MADMWSKCEAIQPPHFAEPRLILSAALELGMLLATVLGYIAVSVRFLEQNREWIFIHYF